MLFALAIACDLSQGRLSVRAAGSGTHGKALVFSNPVPSTNYSLDRTNWAGAGAMAIQPDTLGVADIWGKSAYKAVI